jgi:hypothetical protein
MQASLAASDEVTKLDPYRSSGRVMDMTFNQSRRDIAAKKNFDAEEKSKPSSISADEYLADYERRKEIERQRELEDIRSGKLRIL